MSNLEWLDLRENNLKGPLPLSLTGLTALRTLYFNSTELCAPPDRTFRAWLRGIDYVSGANCEPGTADPRDKAALVALYEATDGENWFSDAPFGEWYGVTTDINSGRVTELDFGWKGNNLRGTLPAELGRMDHLQRLSLTHSNLTGSLPAEWHHLSNLKQLWLSGNRLTGSSAGRVEPPEQARGAAHPAQQSGRTTTRRVEPPAWARLGNLESMDLDNNKLTGELPMEWDQQEHIRVLYLSENSLTGPLPQSLKRLTALEVFYFDDTELCAPRDRAFQEWFRGIGDVRGANC